MQKWDPITEEELRMLITDSDHQMTSAQKKIWEVIQIDPRKWKQEPWGNEGDGFWVVAVYGRRVVWYNDIEDGFNSSSWHEYGVIDEYWCNQDRLEWTMEKILRELLEDQPDIRRAGPPRSLT